MTDAVQLLRAMVRFNSINADLPGSAGGEAALVDWLAEELAAWPVVVRRLAVPDYGEQLLVIAEAGAGRPWVLFDSHLDTVSAEGMTVAPFGGDIRDGRVYGRGACDTKGTGAAMLAAVRRLTEQADRPNNVAVLLSVDEEVAMRGVRAFLGRDLPALGWRPGGVVVGEPSELRPIVAHNGVARWTITTRGVAAHSSVPDRGRSAIRDMMRVFDAVHRQYIDTLDARYPRTGPAVCTVNMIDGGSAPNIVPERCDAVLDRRLVPGEGADAAADALQAVLDTVMADDRDLAVTLRRDVAHPPMLPDDGAGAWHDAVRGVLAGLDLPTLAIGAPYATHGGYFAAAGLPTVVIGPGDGAHTADEHVAVDAVEKAVEVYLGLMRAAVA